MAKSGSKRKKAEKSKTQLKSSMKNAGKADKKKKVRGQSGIKLPKGLNETKPQVHAKSIRLNQITEEEEETSSWENKRHRPIKDILSKMRHHAQFNRSEALKALKGIIKDCPDKLNQDLPNVITRVLGLMIDVEAPVRQLCLEVVELLFTTIATYRLETFSASIGAHLCRSLSHIDQDVQVDALKLLDKLIELTPQIVTKCHQQILPNCLEQISNKSNNNKKTSNLSNVISDKIKVSTWRSNVLLRLAKILKLILQKETLNDTDEMQISNSSSVLLNETYLVPIHSESDDLHELSLNDLKAFFSSNKNLETSFSLGKFSYQVLPLLSDVWCEIISTETKKKKSNNKNLRESENVFFTAEEISMLSSVIDIITMLTNLTIKEKMQIPAKFDEMLMSCFPFTNELSQMVQDVHKLNLQIANFVCREPKNQTDRIKSVLNFLIELHPEKLTSDNFALVSQIILVLSRNVKDKSDSKTLDDFIGKFYRSASNNHHDNNNLLSSKVMSILVKEQNVKDFESLKSWIESIRIVFEREIWNRHHLDTIELLCKRNASRSLVLPPFKGFNWSCEKKKKELIDPTQTLSFYEYYVANSEL